MISDLSYIWYYTRVVFKVRINLTSDRLIPIEPYFFCVGPVSLIMTEKFKRGSKVFAGVYFFNRYLVPFS